MINKQKVLGLWVSVGRNRRLYVLNVVFVELGWIYLYNMIIFLLLNYVWVELRVLMLYLLILRIVWNYFPFISVNKGLAEIVSGTCEHVQHRYVEKH